MADEIGVMPTAASSSGTRRTTSITGRPTASSPTSSARASSCPASSWTSTRCGSNSACSNRACRSNAARAAPPAARAAASTCCCVRTTCSRRRSPLQAEVCTRPSAAPKSSTRCADSGAEVLSLVPSHHNHAIGERIGIRLDVDHVVAFKTPIATAGRRSAPINSSDDPWLERRERPFRRWNGAAPNPTACSAPAATCRRNAAARCLPARHLSLVREGEPILWWSPDPRMVLFPAEFRSRARCADCLRAGVTRCAGQRLCGGHPRLRRRRRAPARTGPGSRRRCRTPTGSCMNSASRTRSRPGAMASWSAASTAWPSAACSTASRCSRGHRCLEDAFAHLARFLEEEGFGMIDCQMKHPAPGLARRARNPRDRSSWPAGCTESGVEPGRWPVDAASQPWI
jgi:hypothetical protein